MHFWRHRQSGLGIHYDQRYLDDAVMLLPDSCKDPEKRLNGTWEIRVPAAALASFGWDAGLAEAVVMLQSMQRTQSSDNDKSYNSALLDAIEELDRMRRIG